MSRMSENPVLKFYLMPVQNEIIVVFLYLRAVLCKIIEVIVINFIFLFFFFFFSVKTLFLNLKMILGG